MSDGGVRFRRPITDPTCRPQPENIITAADGPLDPLDAAFARFVRLIRDCLDVGDAAIVLRRPGTPEVAGPADAGAGVLAAACELTARIVAAGAAVHDRAAAGVPLRDERGRILGAVCAFAADAGDWDRRQLQVLTDLAEICGAAVAGLADRAALAASTAAARALTNRAAQLLSFSERLAAAGTVDEIATALQDVAQRSLGARFSGIWRVDGDVLRHVPTTSRPWPAAAVAHPLALDETNPLGTAALRGRIDLVERRHDLVGEHPGSAVPSDGGARAYSPLLVDGQVAGVLVLAWDAPRSFGNDDWVSVAALTSYTAQAAHRATLLAERTTALHTMQSALLGTLPALPGLTLAARYRPAAARERVGGDWYDAAVLPNGDLLLTLGDVMGHDIAAATAMGTLRTMLRTLAWAEDGTPAATVTRLDEAVRDLRTGTLATLVLGRVSPPSGGTRRLVFANAGHPPPVLLGPDGRAATLSEGRADLLIGFDPTSPRRDREAELPCGATLLLYTDGLVERRTRSLDDGIAALCRAAERHAALPPDQLLDAVLGELPPTELVDDVAVVAVRAEDC